MLHYFEQYTHIISIINFIHHHPIYVICWFSYSLYQFYGFHVTWVLVCGFIVSLRPIPKRRSPLIESNVFLRLHRCVCRLIRARYPSHHRFSPSIFNLPSTLYNELHLETAGQLHVASTFAGRYWWIDIAKKYLIRWELWERKICRHIKWVTIVLEYL